MSKYKNISINLFEKNFCTKSTNQRGIGVIYVYTYFNVKIQVELPTKTQKHIFKPANESRCVHNLPLKTEPCLKMLLKIQKAIKQKETQLHGDLLL